VGDDLGAQLGQVRCCRSVGATGAAVVEWTEWLPIAKVQQMVVVCSYYEGVTTMTAAGSIGCSTK